MNATTKAWAAGGMLLGLMVLAWLTMDSDKVRIVVMIILGLFLFRVVIHAARSRYDE